jgi:hypothetical protein
VCVCVYVCVSPIVMKLPWSMVCVCVCMCMFIFLCWELNIRTMDCDFGVISPGVVLGTALCIAGLRKWNALLVRVQC